MPNDLLRDQLQASLGTAYTIDRELGGGGMSRVFLATDMHLERRVVVKVILPELAAGVSAERFTREIKLAAQLQEPHIVPVLTDGITGEGLAYYTMPYVAGESLRERLKRERIPAREATTILRDVACALAYAHSRDVVHRDIKPDNVLLSEGTAVVTDFGIAKALSISSDEALAGTITGTGVSIGTPAYMSPEQAAGGRVDCRADVYSWGILAYELLAGRHPFAGHTTPRELLAAQFNETPSSAMLERANIGSGLVALVMHALEKDPARRPASGAAVLHSLDALHVRSSSAMRHPRSGQRLRVAIIAASIVAMIVVGTMLVRASNKKGSNADAIGSIAVLPFDNIGGDSADAYLAHGITSALAVTLGRVPDIRVAPGISSRVLLARGLTVLDVAKMLSVDGVLSGTVRRGGDHLRVAAELVDARSGKRVWIDQFEAGRADVFAVEDQITNAIVAALRPRLAGGASPRVAPRRGTQNPAAYDLYMHGRYFWSLRSEEGMRKAMDYFNRAAGKDSDYVLAIAGLADANAVSAWYSYVPPAEGYGRAKEFANRALRLDSARAEPHASLGYVALYYDWDHREAERQFKMATALDSTYATGWQWYGNYLVVDNRADEAIAALRRAQRADPLNRVSVAAVCWGMLMLRHYRDAIAQCGQAIELDSTFAVARLWRGQAMEMLRDTGATRELETATRLSGRSAVFVAALAHAYASSGQAAHARDLLAELTSSTQRYIPSYEVALVHAALGDTSEAMSWLERAYAERSHSMAFLKVDAALDPLRKDPRFRALLQRTGQA